MIAVMISRNTQEYDNVDAVLQHRHHYTTSVYETKKEMGRTVRRRPGSRLSSSNQNNHG
jgi:hypothetical protein